MKRHVAWALVLMVCWACGEDLPIARYEPRSSEEQALKTLLMEFQQGVNQKDALMVAGLIHENGSLMVGTDRKIYTKQAYEKILPRRLEENPPLYLSDAKMDVRADRAEVRIYMTRGEGRFPVAFEMRRDEGRWTIMSWEY